MTPGISLKRCSTPQKHPPAKVAFSISSQAYAAPMMPLAMSHLPGAEPPATQPRRGWLQLATVDITPLRRHRDFRLLFIGRLVSFFGSMITVVAVPYQVYLLAHPLMWLIFAVAALQGSFDALQRPSLDALLPRLVDRDELKAAAALGSLRGTVGMIAGPALAGGLLAVAGLPVTYLVGVAT